MKEKRKVRGEITGLFLCFYIFCYLHLFLQFAINYKGFHYPKVNDRGVLCFFT